MKNIVLFLIMTIMSVNSFNTKAQKLCLSIVETNKKTMINLDNVQKLTFPNNEIMQLYKQDGNLLNFNFSDIHKYGFEYGEPSSILTPSTQKNSFYFNTINNILSIKSDEAIGFIYICDTSGKVLINTYSIGFVTKIDLSDLEKGIYIVRTRTNSQKIFKN